MADTFTVANTTLSEIVQVRWNTTLVLHPPVEVPQTGCVAVNLRDNKWSRRRERFISVHPHEIRQACLRRSLSFMAPTRLRMYKVRVQEQLGISDEHGAKFITVEYVNSDGRVILLDNDEISRLRTIVAELWTRPRFIIFEISLLGAHPIKHLPHNKETYQKWFEWINRNLSIEYLYTQDNRVVYYPRLDETVNKLIQVEQAVWDSLHTFFSRYTHLGIPLDLDYHVEPQQVVAYHYPEKKLTDVRRLELHDYSNGVRPIVYMQEFFSWHYFLDVHVGRDGVVRTNSGRLVSELYNIPFWPKGKLLLSANPLWVITLLETTSVPVEYINGLYLTTDTEQHRDTINSLRGHVSDRVNTLHNQGMYVVRTSDSAISPSKTVRVVNGELLGSSEPMIVLQTLQPNIVSRVMLALS